MSWWRVTVTSEQTIVIGTGATRAFHTPSLGYIPGSTLRGALATAWRIRYGDPDPAFRKTFDHSVRFGPLLAVTGDVANQSVLRRKYAPGDGEYVDCAFEDVGDAVGEHLKGDVIWGDKNALKVVTTTAIDPEKRTALDG
ncbi:MAG: RAMP superfamily CRISPR-associated protein, partial [Arachnia propionica]